MDEDGSFPSKINPEIIKLHLMRVYGHSRIRHLIISSTTAQILARSDIPVLIFR